MKILYDFVNMSGGQPRSHFSHMTLMKSAGHKVVATIGEDYSNLINMTNDIRIIKMVNFKMANPFLNILLFYKWIKVIKIEKPDIIHSIGTSQSKMLAVVSELTGVPLIFSQAGGQAKHANIRPLIGVKAIVFSVENENQLIKVGFNKKDINIISNRISINRSPANFDEKRRDKNVINVLYTSNINHNTINGLLSLLKLIESNKDNFKTKISFLIAGKDVTTNKIYHDTLCNRLQELAIAHKDFLLIKYLGWVDDIESLQSNQDICIGKGRSILQPAMMGKISFVISESGILTRINRQNFRSLYEYNFSGRGLQSNDCDEFVKLMTNNESFLNQIRIQANEAVEIVMEHYLDKYALKKLSDAYTNVVKKKNNVFLRFISALKKFFLIYFYKFYYRNIGISIDP